MSKIIGISGKMQSGKDYATGVIQLTNEEFENKKFASALKRTAGVMLHVDPKHFEVDKFKRAMIPQIPGMTYREFLVDLGTNVARNKYNPDFWVNRLFQEFTPFSSWVVSDVRFPNEAMAIADHGGITIRMERPDMKRPKKQDITETALDGWDFDYVVSVDDGDFMGLHSQILDIMEQESMMA